MPDPTPPQQGDKPEGLPDVQVALVNMRRALASRPNWQKNYGSLLKDPTQASNATAVEVGLGRWLAEKFGAFTAREIEAATAKAVTSSTFAPDPAALLSIGYDSVINSRYGDPQQLFLSVVKNVVLWMSGAQIQWLPVQRYLVVKLGARFIAETQYVEIRKAWHEALCNYIRESEPDQSSNKIFTDEQINKIQFYANAKRSKRDFASLQKIINKDP
jgi:hypothetical protein